MSFGGNGFGGGFGGGGFGGVSISLLKKEYIVVFHFQFQLQ